jgi:uncharacterized membrane protein
MTLADFLKYFADAIASAVEMAAAIIIAFGAAEAFIGILRTFVPGQPKVPTASRRKEIWLRFGVWLLLGLEFELAADVVRTAISPRWSQIGQLAAIAVVRTFLNFFLEKDLEKYTQGRDGSTPTEGQLPTIQLSSSAAAGKS